VRSRPGPKGTLVIIDALTAEIHYCEGLRRRNGSAGRVTPQNDAAAHENRKRSDLAQSPRVLASYESTEAPKLPRLRDDDECRRLLQRARPRWRDLGEGQATCMACGARVFVRFSRREWRTLLASALTGTEHVCERQGEPSQQLERPGNGERPGNNKVRTVQIHSPNECPACGNLLAGKDRNRICFHCAH
jgi:hypothetical protein